MGARVFSRPSGPSGSEGPGIPGLARPGPVCMSLIIASNRLPVTIKEKDGQLEFQESAGGLATGLHAYLHRGGPEKAAQRTWVGWPGGDFPAERQEEVRTRLREQ